MENKKGKKYIIITGIVFVICGMLLISCSVILDRAGTRFGVLSGISRQRALKEQYEEILDRYSVFALSDYGNDFNKEFLSNTNFRYAVIKSKTGTKPDLTDRSKYIGGVYDENDLFTNPHVYSCTISDSTFFSYDMSLFGHGYVNNNQVWFESYSYPVTQLIYNWMDGRVYCKYYNGTSPYVAAVGDYLVNTETGTVINYTYLNETKTDWKWDAGNTTVFLEGTDSYQSLPDIKVADNDSILEYGALDSRICNTNLSGGILYVEIQAEETYREDYYVISQIAEPIDTEKEDLFVQMDKAVNLAYKIKYPLFILTVLSAIGFIVTGIIIFIKFAGWFSKKLVIFGRILKKGFSALSGKISTGWKNIIYKWNENTDLLIRVWVGLIVILGIEFWTLSVLYRGEILLLWFVKSVVLCLIVPAFFMQLRTIQKESRMIAQGDFSHKVDTAKLYYDYRQIGENLNSISAGMETAVKDRMKSEHFKTELITNVSHDIKTPLTSIISYVDLLKKRDIQDEQAKEYLEVLNNQSVKLKKLLEDLIEASKATTGNLKAEMAECNVNVALTQTIGEYKEKLSESDIELIVKVPGEEIIIMADAKHLQRIFDNLMVNVGKYSQPFTRCYINLERQGNNAVIVFRNTSKDALNISEEELLERFVQGDTSRKSEGHGLGLSITRSLCELMNGSMELVVDGDLFKVIIKFPAL